MPQAEESAKQDKQVINSNKRDLASARDEALKIFTSRVRMKAIGKGANLANARQIPYERQREFDFMDSYDLSGELTRTSSDLSQSSDDSFMLTAQSSSTSFSTSSNIIGPPPGPIANVRVETFPTITNGFDYDFPLFIDDFLIERWDNSEYNGELTLTAVEGSPDFSILANTCILKRNSCYVEFSFRPQSEGRKDLMMSARLNDTFYIDNLDGTFDQYTYFQPLVFVVGAFGIAPEEPPQCEAAYPGSEILADTMAMREKVEVVGTGMDLVYSSMLAPEYSSSFQTINRLSYFNPEGWTLSKHHYYSVSEGRLFIGGGGLMKKASKLMGDNHLVIHEDEAYLFGADGRHLETRDNLQNVLLYSFDYDENGKLASISNRFNQQVILDRNTSGNLEKITSFYGQETLVNVDEFSRIISVTNPNQEVHSFEYLDQTLLMTKFTLPSQKSTTFSYEEVSGRLLQEVGPGGSEWNFNFGAIETSQ